MPLNSSRSNKYKTIPKAEVKTPAACFILSNVIFVPNTLLAFILCNCNHDSKFSFGNFKFKITFASFNNNIFCCSHTIFGFAKAYNVFENITHIKSANAIINIIGPTLFMDATMMSVMTTELNIEKDNNELKVAMPLFMAIIHFST